MEFGRTHLLTSRPKTAAVLLTLNNLLEKIPTFLKPFLPQLQRTFAKSLADTTSEMLRARAAKALGTLVALTARVDPLISGICFINSVNLATCFNILVLQNLLPAQRQPTQEYGMQC